MKNDNITSVNKSISDTGWEVSDETEYGGVRSKSWTSYNTPYQVVGMLETAYEMVADYYIELGSHTVEHRYVSLKSLIHCLMVRRLQKVKT